MESKVGATNSAKSFSPSLNSSQSDADCSGAFWGAFGPSSDWACAIEAKRDEARSPNEKRRENRNMRFNHLAGRRKSAALGEAGITLYPNGKSKLREFKLELKRIDAFGQGDCFEKPDPGKEDEKHIAQDGGRAY